MFAVDKEEQGRVNRELMATLHEHHPQPVNNAVQAQGVYADDALLRSFGWFEMLSRKNL